MGDAKRETAADRVREALRPDMVRVGPGRQAWVPKAGQPPALTVCRWAPLGDGAFAPVPVGGRWARLCADLLAQLGFREGSRATRYATLLRLSRAGFIDMVKVSPGCWLIDLDSWHRHLLRCMEDEWMWEPGSEATRRYQFANGLGHRERRARTKDAGAPPPPQK